MIIPIPLCHVIADTQYTSGQTTIEGAFCPYITKEVPSAFHEQGQSSSSGNQKGLVAAHIEGSVSPYRPTKRGDRIVNGPSSNMTPWSLQHPYHGHDVCDWKVFVGWQDREYHYVARCYVKFDIAYGKGLTGKEGRLEVRQTVVNVTAYRRPNSANWPTKPVSGSVNLDQVQTATYTTESADQLISRWDDIPNRTVALTLYEKVGIGPSQVYDIARGAAMSGGLEFTNPPGNKRCYVYAPGEDMVDYEALIKHLLNEYRFNDPLLSKGLVAPHATSTVVKGDYNPLTHKRDTHIVQIARSGPFGTYTFEWLTQHAYYDALSAIRRANANSIQNVMGAFDLLVSLKSGDFSDVGGLLSRKWAEWTQDASSASKFISSLWLRYRYELTTTNADLKEYGDYLVDQIDRIARGNKPSRVHGHAKYDGVDCNCSLSWSEKFLNGINAVAHSLWKTGMLPDEYVFWDFIPFSFIADWNSSMPEWLRKIGIAPPFSGNVGDVLEVQSNSRFYNSGYYNISDVVFSFRYDTSPRDGLTASHYVRFVDYRPVIQLDYWFDSGDSSTSLSTLVKRGTDGAALTTGFIL
jgi:hypothetical protein